MIEKVASGCALHMGMVAFGSFMGFRFVADRTRLKPENLLRALVTVHLHRSGR